MHLFKRLHAWFKPSTQVNNTPALSNDDAAFLNTSVTASEESGISNALAQELKNGAELFSQLEHIREETHQLNEWVHQYVHDWTTRQTELKEQLCCYEQELDHVLSRLQEIEQRLDHHSSEKIVYSDSDKDN